MNLSYKAFLNKRYTAVSDILINKLATSKVFCFQDRLHLINTTEYVTCNYRQLYTHTHTQQAI